MKCASLHAALFAAVLLFGLVGPGICDTNTPPKDILLISGTITNSHAKPVKNSEVIVYVDGREMNPDFRATTSKEGKYEAEVSFPVGTIPGVKIAIEANKPSYVSSDITAVDGILRERTDEQGNN